VTRWAGRWSLHRALIGIALAVTAVAWTTGCAVVFRLAVQNSERLHDEMLRQTGQLILTLSGHELEEIGSSTPLAARIANQASDTQKAFNGNYRYQLWTRDGRLLLSNFGLPSAAAMARMGRPGWSWLEMDGERWRVYSVADPDLDQELQIAERAAVRDWFGAGFDGDLVAAAVVLVLAIVGLAVLAIRRVMRPLRQLHEQLATRSPSRLDRVEIASAPQEIEPVTDAVNALFARVKEAIEREAGFTAMAAHELRTPLATVRMLAQLAASTGDEAQRHDALRELVRGADRCAHLQEQLLTLARLDAARPGELGTRVELTEILLDAVAEVAPDARARRIEIRTHVDGSAMRGHAFGVRTLLRNVLGNALKYTPDGGRVAVEAGIEEDDLVVTIDDSGPGIAPAERGRVFERFERLDNGKVPGVGLGLAIVRTVVDLHGARIDLDDAPLGGLRVRIRFVDRAIAGSSMPFGDSVSGEAALPSSAA
jgi:signal transduction histidine kinase